MRHVNNLGPTKFRTGAENGKEQVSYFNYNKKTELLNNLWPLENKHLQVKLFFLL